MKIPLVIAVAAFSAVSLLAQPREGKTKELGLSGMYQNYSTGSSSGNTSALLISPRLGFFVVEGLELEPELFLLFPSSGDPVYVLNGNVSYNFKPDGNTLPFILLGYGYANTVPFLNIPLVKTDFGVGVLNLGAGIKAFLEEDIAVRFEYRYQQFRGEGETTVSGIYFYTQKVDTRIHSVQFGLSVLL
jgi:hypothetical protein